MDYLQAITRGKQRRPVLMLLGGVDGIGKTTFAAAAPDVVFLPTEDGTSFLNVARLPAPTNYKMAMDMIDALITGPHDFKSFAFDSVDHFERLEFAQVVEDQGNPKIKGIEDLGYGKGYVIALEYWHKFMTKIQALRDKRNMNIILIGHFATKVFKDPQNQTEYERYQLKMHDKAAAYLRESVDYVLFANFEVNVFKDDKKKTRAFGEGERILYTERRPGFDAKSRTPLPFEMPLSWDDFYAAYIAETTQSPEQIIERIMGFAEMMPPEVLPKIKESIEAAKNDAPRLEQILTRVNALAQAS